MSQQHLYRHTDIHIWHHARITGTVSFITRLILQLPPPFQAGTSVAASYCRFSTIVDSHHRLSKYLHLSQSWKLKTIFHKHARYLSHICLPFSGVFRRYYRDGSSVGTVGLALRTNLWLPTSHVLTPGLLLASSKFTDLRPTLHVESTTTGLPHRLLCASALTLISVGPPSCKA